MVWSGADHLLVVDGEEILGVISWPDIEAFTYEPPDGLPLPPTDLMRLVIGGHPVRLPRAFYESGARMASVIRALLDRNGTPLEQFASMLDFGCGCGRLIRHWKDANSTTICGSDYNPLLIDWCRDNLGFAEFTVNELAPGLPHEEGRFDFIYALSVFTHLPEELQGPWMAELDRVLSPGGTLLITVHGLSHVGRLDADQREAFLAGDLVVSKPTEAGSNECSVYHPERYVYDELSKDLEVVAFLPEAAHGMQQDVVLLSKPG